MDNSQSRFLYKNEQIEIPKENPFKNDVLAREKNADVLTKLIKTITQPFVISLEAPWGYGKTTFVKMWKQKLENQGFFCLYFNAWSTDFVADPLVAFIGELEDMISTTVDNMTDGSKSINTSELVQLGEKILKASVPGIINLVSMGAIPKEIVSILVDNESEGKGRIKKFKEEKKWIGDFRKELEKLARQATKLFEKKTPIIVFIDELDRCKPDYAVVFLERIKHLLSVENIVYVLSIDRVQLESSVKSIFGDGMEVDGYLRKFIDLRYDLPEPDKLYFCRFLKGKFEITDGILAKGRIANESNVVDIISGFINYSEMSLRVIEQCFITLNLVLRTGALSDYYVYLIPFLICLKVRNINFYKKLKKRYLNGDQIADELIGIDNWKEIFRNPIVSVNNQNLSLGPLIHARLLIEYLDKMQYSEKYSDISRIALEDTNPDSKYFDALKRSIDWQKNPPEIPSRFIRKYISQIDLMEDFQN